MKSVNFEFLRSKRAELADLGAFAEQYAHSDPQSSLLKQRSFIETAVPAIYAEYRLRLPFGDNLNDRLVDDQFKQAVPAVVVDKFHFVRQAGNRAAHGKPVHAAMARDSLTELFDLAKWFHVEILKGARTEHRPFVAPASGSPDANKAKEALEKLRIAEAKFNNVLDEETKKRILAQEAAERSQSELAALKAAGQQTASLLEFNEETTRHRLIDQYLLAAGWDVGAQGKNTDQVRQEVALVGMKTESGDGRADYVLYGDDGKPLAVIEAKRAVKDSKQGAEQARLYADCLEKQTGVRPVIFFTNGGDIFLWDDAQGYPWRKVYGFYSKDSLEYLVLQRRGKALLTTVSPNQEIAGRMYQLEAVKRVTERFTNKFRKALLVQATGTGKTRVAISIVDVLMRAQWAKRILFLCDRRELRRQADRAFKEYITEPRVVVSSATAAERDKRIYLATYPAMMECYESFDVGFFDLIIADESHRSVYKTFRALFLYFDALEVGLTATPVKFIERNTFGLFGCENNDPTTNFSLEEAIDSKPPYLVPFRVRSFKSKFREDGIKYSQMNDQQRGQVEDQQAEPETVEFEPEELDKHVFNKDTTRGVWRSLMEEGIRESTGSRVGKTIVFARNHLHAVHLAEVFSELYPMYGSTFCRVIDNQEPKAENLIDDFKDPAKDLTIAISVDMLDTGIDVPEVVNLVFAKPVKSFVKFWQMIGRGTRLCKNLFGPAKDKTEFLIFDHWSNFWFFDEVYKEVEPKAQKSLLQRLFETRIELADEATRKMAEPVFQATVDRIVEDVQAAKDSRSIEVRDKWKEMEQLSERDRVAQYAAVTRADLLSVAAPLMQWRNLRGDEDAYRFDLLMNQLQLEVMRGGVNSPPAQNLRARVLAQVELLGKNQNPVKAKAETINTVRENAFWSDATVPKLEEVRTELRGIMKYQQHPDTHRLSPQLLDVDDPDFVGTNYVPKMDGLQLVEYRLRVQSVLEKHFAENPTIARIKAHKAVREEELEELAKLLLKIDDQANVRQLTGGDPSTRRSLLDVFRSLVGLDAEAVEQAFAAFVSKHPGLSSQQLRFLQMLRNHIGAHGGIEIARLYEQPFTSLHAESLDGVFTGPGEVDEILTILAAFEPKKTAPSDPPPASQSQAS